MGLGNWNMLGGSSNTGEAGQSTDNLLSITDALPQLKDTYADKVYGAVDGAGGEAHPIQGTDSAFNPFYVFRYAKYGSIGGADYSPEYHRDLNDISSANQAEAGAKGPVKTIQEQKAYSENPTAGKIIEWAAASGDQNKGDTIVGALPYQWNDFLWCKWYGKIPNNRLLTLRRYPIPVEDSVHVAESKAPLIPIAQAVTWWGGETGNKLSSLLGIQYGWNWTPKSAKVQDVAGNEIQASAILDVAGVTQADNPNLRAILLATMFNNNDNPYAATGYDEKIQNWITTSYGDEGQYWNRVRGPLNVINTTLIRTQGFTYAHPITMKFAYKLRSFSNINPRIAMLDLITNFLSLTYNKAEFWGGGIRYFQKTGFILPGIPSAKFEQGDFIGGIQEVIQYMLSQLQGKAAELTKAVGSMAQGVADKDLGGVLATVQKSQAAQNIAGSWVSQLMATPLLMRSFLDGRAVGEWHLTIGNPMNPLAVIGNLCMTSTKIEFSDSLGLDDFPTEVTFTVILDHGRPRAKQDIESMFNFGGGSMAFTALPQSSASYNSYGERNSITANNARLGRSDVATPASQAPTQAQSSAQIFEVNTETGKEIERLLSTTGADKLAGYFKSKVARAYGTKFAESPSLPDYFRQLKTKD